MYKKLCGCHHQTVTYFRIGTLAVVMTLKSRNHKNYFEPIRTPNTEVLSTMGQDCCAHVFVAERREKILLLNTFPLLSLNMYIKVEIDSQYEIWTSVSRKTLAYLAQHTYLAKQEEPTHTVYTVTSMTPCCDSPELWLYISVHNLKCCVGKHWTYLRGHGNARPLHVSVLNV